MQPSPSSTQWLLKALPGASQSPSDELGLLAGGGWLGPSLTYLLQVPCGTASARSKVYRQFTNSCCSSWRQPRRRGTNASSEEFLQPAPRSRWPDLVASVLVGGRPISSRSCGPTNCAYGAHIGDGLAMPLRHDDLSTGCRGSRNLS